MRAIMMLTVLLSLVLYTSCDKKDVEPKSELIEVSFNATLYALDFETDIKSVPGYPDIPHITDLNLYPGQIYLRNIDKDYLSDIQCEPGQFDTMTVFLEPGNYTLENAFFEDVLMDNYNSFWKDVRYYLGSCIIGNTSIPNPVIYSISDVNSEINFEIATSLSCYVFRDPDNLLEEITVQGNPSGEGILKSEMNTVVDQYDETFYYCYHSVSNLWIHTTDGGRLSLNFADYYNSLDIEDQYFYISAGDYITPSYSQPFTVYTTVSAGNTAPDIEAAFGVSGVWPNVEVEISLE